MAHGKRGRRPAHELGPDRCAGHNVHGGTCGNPRLPDMPYCLHHLGAVDRAKAATTGERLLEMTGRALDALDEILLHGAPDVKVRAAKLILDRTQPASGPHAVVLVSSPGAVVGTPQATAADVVRARLAELRSRTREIPSTATVLDDRDVIIDADIIEPEDDRPEPEPPAPPVVAWDLGAEAEPVHPAPRSEPVTVVREQAYGVPRVTSRPADLEQMAWDRGRV